MSDAEIDEFLAQVDRRRGADACWPWKGKTVEGYGYWAGEGAHRIAYRLKHGSISEGAVIRHECDNPPCCNPAHLKAGTHADNHYDCVKKGRHARGESHGLAKLTEREVRLIREHKEGWTHAEIARAFQVSRSTVTRLRNPEKYPSGFGLPESRPQNDPEPLPTFEDVRGIIKGYDPW